MVLHDDYHALVRKIVSEIDEEDSDESVSEKNGDDDGANEYDEIEWPPETSTPIDVNALCRGEAAVFEIDNEICDKRETKSFDKRSKVHFIYDGELFNSLKRSMTSLTKDEGIMKKIERKGIGSPVGENTLVTVEYEAFLEGSVDPFDSSIERSKHFKFTTFDGTVLPGFSIAVASMSCKEIASFILAPEYYYGKIGCEPRIPPNTSVLFKIKLIKAEKNAPVRRARQAINDELKLTSFTEIMKVCETLRQLGNEKFSKSLYPAAFRYYKTAIGLAEKAVVNNNHQQKLSDKILHLLYLNCAQVALDLNKPAQCVTYSRLALNINRKSVKALYRAGIAHRKLGNYEKSKNFLEKAISIEPTNEILHKELKQTVDLTS